MSTTRDDTDQIDRFHTTIECRRDGDAWKATEPAAEGQVFGRGSNPREAVKNYVEALE